MKRLVLKNASANLFRLVMSGIVALLLPPFLVRTLSTATYSTWVLLLQVAGYVSLFEFGIQTAIARFVAHAEELEDVEQRDGIVSTAFLLLVASALVGLCILGLAAWQLPRLFPAMPVGLRHESQITLLVMGASFALGLPFAAIQSVFVGRQRNEIPAAILILSKGTTAALIVFAARANLGILAMGAGVAVANAVAAAASLLAWRVWASTVRIRISLASRSYARQIISYCTGLGVWSLGMLMVSGLDLTIVGVFDYQSTVYYSVAVTLTSVMVLTQNAVIWALLPASAVLNAREDSGRLGSLLVVSTRYGMLLLLFMATPLMLGSKTVFDLWMGKGFAAHSTLIMQLLVVANVVRLSFLPYAILLLGAGLQRKVLLSPIAEGVTNLLASVAGAFWWGAPGVALGTLIGSVVGVGVHFGYHMPRTLAIAIDRHLLLKEGIIRPLACVLPFLALICLRILSPNMSSAFLLLSGGLSLIVAACLLWNVGLKRSERQLLARRWI